MKVTVAGAARIAEVSEETIRAWANSGLLQVERTESGVRLFEREDVERAAAAKARRGKDAA